MNNQPKATKIPELINQDTQLREFRFRRFDCLHLRETSNTEECSTNEEINPDTSNATNININESTPWLTNKSRTIVNPTLQRNSTQSTIEVKAYLRFIDPKNNQEKDHLYTFQGSLTEYKRNNGSSQFITLNPKSNSFEEKVNATLYCIDKEDCKEIILTFAFTNYNLGGQKFIDSRHFHLDDRERKPVPSDYIPGKATQTINEIKTEPETPINETKDADQDHEDDGFVDMPQGPVLPKEEGSALCRGLVSNDTECPAYIVDSNLPKPSIHDQEIKIDKIDITHDETEQALFPGESLILLRQNYANLTKEELINSRNNFLNPPQLKRHIIPQLDPKLLNPKESELAQKTSIRPKPRPNSLKQNTQEFTENNMTVPFQSIDGEFTYNLALCADHLEKTKTINYNQASGFYSNGRLQDASHYSNTEYPTNSLTKSRTSNQYSSEITKQIIEYTGCVLNQKYKENLHTNINDLSKKNGGRLGGHKSHQNGLDADISYPHINRKTNNFDDFTSNITTPRVIAALDMARIMIYTDRILTLFTDDRIRKKFCKYLKDEGKLTEYRPLIEDFMHHVKGHHNHYHIRVKCNSQNQGCTTQGRLSPDKICG